MNRKTYGGNRTENGANTQSVLASFLVTATQQGHDAIELLVGLIRHFHDDVRDAKRLISEP